MFKKASAGISGPPSTSSAGSGGGAGGGAPVGALSKFLKSSKTAARKMSIAASVSVDTPAAEAACSLTSARGGNKSRTLVMLFSTLDEFGSERELLRAHVIPELQQHCCDRDADLECLTFFETGDMLENVEQLNMLRHMLADPSHNVFVLSFIGDKYGELMLPLDMRTDEFAGIQMAAAELSADAELLEQFYSLRKENDVEVYRLRPLMARDPTAARRLSTLIQKAAKKAFDDGHIHQINEDRQAHFNKSFIETFADVLLESPANHLFVTRKVTGYQPADVERWVDGCKISYAKINELKNRVSGRLQQSQHHANYFPFIFSLADVNATGWLKSKEFAAYERQLAQKLCDRLKHLFAIPSLPCGLHFPTASPLAQTRYFVDVEDGTHEATVVARTPVAWAKRPALDTKLTEIVEAVFAPEVVTAAGPRYVLFHGANEVGKTALMCQLRKLLLEKAALSPDEGTAKASAPLDNIVNTTDAAPPSEATQQKPSCLVIARIVGLTECSMFANELFRNVFIKAATAAGDESAAAALHECFHLGVILSQADAMLRQFDRPMVLLIDDAHLLHYGGVLSKVEKPILSVMPPHLTIVLFSSSSAPLLGLPADAQLVEVPPPGQTVIIEALKYGFNGIGIQNFNFTLLPALAKTKGAKKKKSTDDPPPPLAEIDTTLTENSALLPHYKTEAPLGVLLLASVQRDELLAGQSEASADLAGRLALIELRAGADNMRIICQLLCCAAPYGLTRLELTDALRLRKRSSGIAFESDGVMSAAAFNVLRHLGCLVSSHSVNGRELLTFAHASVLRLVRARYLQSTGEVKLTHETLARVLSNPTSVVSAEILLSVATATAANDAAPPTTTPGVDFGEAISACLLFPQPLYRDNGAINLRRVRFYWYFLLYSGDITMLKTEALCSFDYLEAVFRGCGLAHLLSIFEECLLQILDHDLLAIFEKVLIPSTPTLTRDPRQFVSEFLNRLRYTRSKNNVHLNNFVEQAMNWTDKYNEGPLLVPLTCWIPPPKTKEVVSFALPEWQSSKTVLQQTFNHQHFLVSGNDADPGAIYMFHIASQQLRRTLQGHDSRVSAICTSRDGQFFVSCAHDGAIKIWNIAQSEECIKTLKVSEARILCALLSADDKWVVTGSVDSTARVVSIESGIVLRTFRDHTGPVVGLQLSSDNELLITGSGDFAVMVWDIEKSTIILKMGGLMAPVTCLTITSNDAFLAVACEDETLKVFSTVSAQELHELSCHDSRINALAVSSDDCQLFAATRGKVLIYDIHNGQLLEVLPCQTSAPVTSLKISDDNSFILAACGERVHMWNMNSIERDSLQNERSALACVCIAPDEKGAGCGTIDGILAFWDLDVCQCLWTTSQQKTGAVTSLDFTVDSLYLLSGSAQGSVSMWEVSTGQLLRQMQVHIAGEVTSISCLADGFRVLSADKSCQVQLWSLSSYVDEAFSYTSSSGPTAGSSSMVQFGGSPSLPMISTDDMLATISDLGPPIIARYSVVAEAFVIVGQNAKKQKEVNIWSLNMDSRVVLKAKAHHNQDIVCYHMNRIGTALVTGSLDLSLKVWQTDSGFLTQVLVGHAGVITCCCISEDGRTVASGSHDKQIIVWDVSMGTTCRTISTLHPLVYIELSQDSSVILSDYKQYLADKSGWIEAWETSTGQLLSSFNTHRRVQQLIMSMDGNRILARLLQTAQLPILCLHNSPASIVPIRPLERKISANAQRPPGSNLTRLQSTSSFTSDASRVDDVNAASKAKKYSGGGEPAVRPGSSLSRQRKDSSAGEKRSSGSGSTKNDSGSKSAKNSVDGENVATQTSNSTVSQHTTNRKSTACDIL